MINGLDAASPPSLDQAKIAFSQGFRWCGFYPNGKDGDEDPFNTWPLSSMDILIEGGLHPVPIFVPVPNLLSDPIDAASEWYSICKAYNLSPGISVLYDGNHISKSGQISGPLWLPIPGIKPASVGPMSAIQWGQGTINGWLVDFNVSADDFPMSNAVVVDFEFNTAAGLIGIDWYNTFQKKIFLLSNNIHIEVDSMLIGNDPTGKFVVIGRDPSNGNLMIFTREDNNNTWSVIDITEKIHLQTPGDPRTYQVA